MINVHRHRVCDVIAKTQRLECGADSGTNMGILADVSLILQASFSVIKNNRTNKGLPAVPSSCYKNGMKLCDHHFIVTKYPKYQTYTQKRLLPKTLEVLG